MDRSPTAKVPATFARDAAETQGLELINVSTRDADTPLSDLGHEQAAALARWFAAKELAERPNVLNVLAIRACTTDGAAAGRDSNWHRSRRNFRRTSGSARKSFGILDRHTRHGILSKFPELAAQRALVGKFYFRPPGGESWCGRDLAYAQYR
jgi:broad specificity phosphatase PhoE